MHFTSKMKLSCRDRLDQVRFIAKKREDNYVTDRVSFVHVETELLGTIWPCVIYDEN